MNCPRCKREIHSPTLLGVDGCDFCELIECARAVVNSRDGDIVTEDGSRATCGDSEIIRLEMALEAFACDAATDGTAK
jgi:hypothetical protein